MILETISSRHKIHIEKFSEYTIDCEALCPVVSVASDDVYNAHNFNSRCHFIKNALLPIGQLLKEAAEARNKHFRQYHQNFARKFSRESCNLDVLNRLLLSSDPLLSGIKPTPRKKKQNHS